MRAFFGSGPTKSALQGPQTTAPAAKSATKYCARQEICTSRSKRYCACLEVCTSRSQSAVLAMKSALQGPQSVAPATKSTHQFRITNIAQQRRSLAKAIRSKNMPKDNIKMSKRCFRSRLSKAQGFPWHLPRKVTTKSKKCARAHQISVSLRSRNALRRSQAE